ncbi:MAG: signal recognition particle protein [Clostridiales bacterium]|nr:signal recognition particle protein [Clostridiales bacterium]
MGLFSSLAEKLGNVFSKITSRGKLTEGDIKQAMREIRIALLEADVNYAVVKDFVARVSEKAVGEVVLKSLTPGQQVVKIVNDELVELMGSTNSKLEVAPKPPTVILMCGLQGAGKTTFCGKLGAYLTKQGKKPMLAACDVYRPAAINQLQVVGKKVNIPVFEQGTGNPVKIARNAVKEAERLGNDTVIIDTAGRLHINEQLMTELKDIIAETKPTEILLTVDAMTGQDAVNVAKTFDDELGITGVILTKLDGDTRGGAALSIRSVTGKPIKFCGTGEKTGDIEPFHPDRMASRILGMGDVLTLIEKAQNAVTEDEMRKMEKRIRENKFTLEDFLTQFKSLAKMGDINEVMAMIPGMNRANLDPKQVDERINRYKSIILSMTPQERNHPEIIKASRRKRIANGSGTSVQDVNSLLKQYEQTREMLKAANTGKMPQMQQKIIHQKRRFR